MFTQCPYESHTYFPGENPCEVGNELLENQNHGTGILLQVYEVNDLLLSCKPCNASIS